MTDIQILLEEQSVSTEENAKMIRDILGAKITDILLLSDSTHLPRASLIFEKNGFQIESIIMEEELRQRSKHHETYIKKFHRSKEFLLKHFLLEPVARFLWSTEL